MNPHPHDPLPGPPPEPRDPIAAAPSGARAVPAADPVVDPSLDTSLRETETLLRQALRREAETVRPSADGLARILGAAGTGAAPGEPVRRLATVEIETVGRPELAAADDGPRLGARISRLLPRPRRRGSPSARPRDRLAWLPAMAAAAVAAVLAGSLGAVRLGVLHSPGLAAVIGNTSEKPRAAAPSPLPVYLISQQQGRWALVREFSATTLTQPGERLTAALRLAVAGTASDPDLTSAWSVAGLTDGGVRADAVRVDAVRVGAARVGAARVGAVRVGDDAAGLVVHLSGSLLGGGQEKIRTAVRTTLAQLAVQQLVWTATAVVGRDVPVRVEGPASSSVLFSVLPLGDPVTRAVGPIDPRAPVWVSSITDGQSVHVGTVLVSGDALTTGTGMIDWSLAQSDGTVLAIGQEALTRADGRREAPEPGERGVFQIHLTLPAPDRYELSVTQSWADTGPAGGTWTDTKTLVAA